MQFPANQCWWNFCPEIYRQSVLIFWQSPTYISCYTHLKCIDITGEEQQVTCTFIQLVWELKQLWKITSTLHLCCKRGWMGSLLLSTCCILFILHMLGLILCLKEILFTTSIILVKRLEQWRNRVNTATKKFVSCYIYIFVLITITCFPSILLGRLSMKYLDF